MARSGSAGSAAGFCVATCYPKSGICKKSPFGSFYDFCPLKLRHGTSVVRLTQNASDGQPKRQCRSVARTQNLSHAGIFTNSMILSKTVFVSKAGSIRRITENYRCYIIFAIAYFHKTKKVTRNKLHPRWCTPSCDQCLTLWFQYSEHLYFITMRHEKQPF